ncbi:ABC transporter permease [Alkalilimnicola ehrlichii MLHE-1]|uniref:ABC transporter, permease protein, putative n=1 Tax=Alkalilimnicola ehrlichii (strain ATCC BAA-1101 / DSM 17681 / MLHE-1) TaxID=187272 RepID=Q0A5A1_ALKEH|nr:ABC transporter permease [Alkalilimnicola ehrlichii]ABI57986.1 ABC transporter, permease protein, putative [Alkalilimnicola ehrlichii MLHE-1]
MIALMQRELRALLGSPLFWGTAAIAQLILGWWFLSLVDRFRDHYQGLLTRTDSALGVTDLVVQPYFGSFVLLVLLILVVSVLAMGALADERRSGSLPLLLSAPINSGAIVLGKYLGRLLPLTLIIALWSVMPVSLRLFTDVDPGVLAAAVLGLWLMGAALLAVGVFLSTLTAQPGLAAANTFGFALLLMLVGQGTGLEAGDAVLTGIGLVTHYEPLVTGRVGTDALAYFGLLLVGSLLFATRRVDALRLS